MGRYYWSKKEEADGLKQVSVSFLRKHGYFSNGWHSGAITWSWNGEKTGSISVQSSINENEQYVKFIYTQTGNNTDEKKDFDYKIPLTTTPMLFWRQKILVYLPSLGKWKILWQACRLAL